MTRLVLIVNADDYGLAAGVNRGIERANLDGIVTSTTVMTNQIAAADAADLRRRCPDLGVGIHLTLTHGSPVAPVDRVRTLLDLDGRLLRRGDLLSRLRSGGVDPSEIVTECAAQVQALRALGIEPDHWDVHQHLQECNGLREPITVAMRRERVLRARNPLRASLGLDRLRPKAILQARRRAPNARLIADTFTTPDLLLEAQPGRWANLIGRLPDGVVEAICHPAQSGEALQGLGIDSAERIDQLTALCDKTLRQRLDERQARLATFREAFEREDERMSRPPGVSGAGS